VTFTYRTFPPQNWHSGPCQPSAQRHWPSSWHCPSFWQRPPWAVQLKAAARWSPLKQPWKRSSVRRSRHFRLYFALNVGEVLLRFGCFSGCSARHMIPLVDSDIHRPRSCSFTSSSSLSCCPASPSIFATIAQFSFGPFSLACFSFFAIFAIRGNPRPPAHTHTHRHTHSGHTLTHTRVRGCTTNNIGEKKQQPASSDWQSY